MSGPTANQRARAVVKARGKSRIARIAFGDVVIYAAKPSPSQVKQNVAASSAALERASKRLVKPGVRIQAKKGVPLYSADPERPGVYIRTLDGKTEHGVLENGAFKVTG